jgi:hypothetical protein
MGIGRKEVRMAHNRYADVLVQHAGIGKGHHGK